MQRITLKSLALTSSLGLLSACPASPATTDTDATSTGTTTDDPGATDDPSNVSVPTTSNTTPADPTDDPVTTSATTTTATDTTASTGEPGSSTTLEPTTGEPDSLCTRLGGMADDGIPSLVGKFLTNVLADDKINGYFLNSDIDGGALGTCITAQLGELADCPGVMYECQSMKEVHTGLGISAQDFEDFIVDFVAAYDDHAASHPELTDDDKATIGSALGDQSPDIVEDLGNDATVYQRVGRKPAIKTVIGHPGEAGTFVDNVVNDPVISGFFTMDTDFDRFNTCLTRQVSGLDGPVKYGLEVTAPDGIDPGVSVDDPCRDMKSAHAGMQDEMMEGITIEDFLALVGDLVTAMTTFGVPQPDQDIILAALGPMCDDIIALPNTCPGNFKTESIAALGLNLPIDGNPANGAWDNKYNGKIDSMLCVDMVVADDGLNFVQDVRLEVGMDHSYVGDITIKVVSPAGKILTALGRPGPEAPLADTGVPCCGSSANLGAMFPFVLANAATIGGKDMGKGLGNNQVICKDENPKLDPCQFKPYKGGGPGTDFSDYAGDNSVGTWKVCFGDSGAGDLGKLQDVTMTLDKVKYAP